MHEATRRLRAGTASVLIAAFAACAAPQAGRAAGRTARERPASDAPTAPEPVPFAPGTADDGRWYWRLTFTPDGPTAYFAVSDGWFPATRSATIVRSERLPDGTWSEPVTASFSGTYSDMDPFITPDGRRLYFSSRRPHGNADRDAFDIRYVERTAGGWSEPARLGPEVNTDLDELYASTDAGGTLYFASGPPAPGPARTRAGHRRATWGRR